MPDLNVRRWGIFTITHEHHHFTHPDKATADQLWGIISAIGKLNKNMEKLMASFDDLKAKQDETDAKISTVKADVEKLLGLLAAIPPAGMTAEQQAALDAAVAHAGAINDSLSAVDAAANPAP